MLKRFKTIKTFEKNTFKVCNETQTLQKSLDVPVAFYVCQEKYILQYALEIKSQ